MPPDESTAPPTIPDYEFIRLVGRGSYGDVWLARGVTGIFRAIKIVWRARFDDPQPYEREFRGLKEFATISLTESRQLALLHVGRHEAAGFFYYVMELADDVVTGRDIDPASYVPHTLKEVRTRRGRLPAAEVIALAAELARALAGLHTRGLVHRDIKPSNIILVGGAPKLADIGLVASASAGLTFVGTEGYVPPEGPGAPAADVFALGKLLYELATGLDRHDYPRLPGDLHTLPDRKELLELNEILIRACEPNAAKRHADARALLDDLLLLQAGKSVRRLRNAERRVTRALRVAAVLAVVAAVAGTGAWVERKRAEEETQLRRTAEAERDAAMRRSVYAATLAQTRRALTQHDYTRARQLLEQAKPAAEDTDLRGLEWRALWHEARGTPGSVIRKTGAVIDQLSLAPDGKLLAVHDEEKTVRLYDTVSHAETLRIENVQRLAGFSSDGRWIVGTAAQPLAAAQRWDAVTGAPEPVAPAAPHFRPLAAQGPHRLVGIEDARPARPPRSPVARGANLLVWDFSERRMVVRLPLDETAPSSPWEFFRSAANPQGTELALACVKNPGAHAQFRLTKIELAGTPSVHHQTVDDFLPSALGRLDVANEPTEWWAGETATGSKRVYRPAAAEWSPTADKLPVGIVAQAGTSRANGPILLQAYYSEIVLREIGSPPRVEHRSGHGALITALAVGAGQPWFFSASQNGELRAWPIGASPPVLQRPCWNSHARPTSLAFSPDGKTLVVPEDGADSVLLEVQTLKELGRFVGMRRPLFASPDGFLGLSADSLSLGLWNRTHPHAPEIVFRAKDPIASVHLAPEGRWAAVVLITGEMIRLRRDASSPTTSDIMAGDYRVVWPHVIADDGSGCWTIGRSNELSRRRWPDGEVDWRVALPSRATQLCRVGQDSRMAVALENGEVQIHDATNGNLLQRFPSGSSAAQGIVSTRDGARLIAAGIEGNLHILDAITGTYLTEIPIEPAVPLHHVGIAADTSVVAVLNKTGTLHIVPAPLDPLTKP